MNQIFNITNFLFRHITLIVIAALVFIFGLNSDEGVRTTLLASVVAVCLATLLVGIVHFAFTHLNLTSDCDYNGEDDDDGSPIPVEVQAANRLLLGIIFFSVFFLVGAVFFGMYFLKAVPTG